MNTDGSVTNSVLMLFGSSGSPFSFTSAAATSSSQLQPVGSGDQMNMEDRMAEDQPVQASTLAIPAFGKIPISNPSSSGFIFSSAVPSAGNPFQFGGTQNQSTPQNPSPFQAFGSLDFGGGGSSFSLGSDGKANPSHRRIVRVKHLPRRRHQPVQASTPTILAFGQVPISNPSSSGFMFSSAVPSAGNPFQFGGTHNQSTAQNPSPFQASGSLDFGGGGSSFSSGSGGDDEANRRIVRVKHKKRRRIH
ncbi:hypothetical protein Vadar_009751 [Vaccinium darrowii]|uniref:Uncharacterized protein n=1 Tax=Vaccinium darrowii TaxID=229202 RepID=A0ACB7XGE4_9ERIC|nr:hypothetical protein Vadar_009751 [Vaccinium darrowii]